MDKIGFRFAIALILTALLFGCGGGTHDVSNDAGQAFSYGALSGRAVGMSTPVLTNSSSVSVVGLTGVISTLELEGSKDLNQTKIAFVSNRDSEFEIYTMNIDGSNPIRLTNLPAAAWTPAWSPDGTRIAYGSNRDDNWEIYVMNADGSHQTRLTNTPGSDKFPVWSPDGSRVAFQGNYNLNWEVYVINADGSHQILLTKPPDTAWSPTWSPDGSRIAFAGSIGGISGIYTMNADGSHQARVPNTRDTTNLSWSPDGTKIAFVSRDNFDIYTISPDGSNESRLTYNAFVDGSLSWSPDGTRIVYQRRIKFQTPLYVMNADGSNQTLLVDGIANASPAWSPFPPPRKLIGAGARMGIGADGFLYARVGKGVSAGIVTFNAFKIMTAQPLLLTSPSGLNSQDSALVYDLETADHFTRINDLRYWNPATPAPVQVDLSSGPAATGALISFGAQDGLVKSVMLFNSTSRSALTPERPVVTEAEGQRVIRGHFVGVWDASGKNLAPQGASEMTLDTKTGEVLSVR